MTKRMSGYDAFVKMADIREDFLDEAYLPALFPVVSPPPRKRGAALLWGALRGHAVAATVCGVLALGILTAVIALTPLNPFRDPPPVTEPPTEETSDPAETPPVSEEQTESETEPPLWELEEPYELIYTSNGDGTCRVSEIRVSPLNRETFTLTIPATSPNGERVISVENPHGFRYTNVPYILLPDDFEALHDRILTHFGEDFWRFESYYDLMSVEKYTDEERKNEMIAAYPLVTVTDFYILNQTIVEEELTEISGWIAEAAPDYVAYRDEKRIHDLAVSYDHPLTWRSQPFADYLEQDECRFVEAVVLEEGIKSIGDQAFCWAGITSLTLPAGLTHIGNEAFSDCRALAQIEWPVDASLKSIGEEAFFLCDGLTELTLTGDGLEIGRHAFAYCGAGTVILGAGVASVGELAFFSSWNLENLRIGQDVTYIGPDAFRQAGNRMQSEGLKITFDEGCQLTELSDSVFDTTIREITLPVSITRIGYFAFYEGEIGYAGTVAQWEAVEKDERWSYKAITVHCTDGDVIFDPKKN